MQQDIDQLDSPQKYADYIVPEVDFYIVWLRLKDLLYLGLRVNMYSGLAPKLAALLSFEFFVGKITKKRLTKL
jgi:hypothetical protein